MDDEMPHDGEAGDLFLELTPEKVLEAVERSGLRTHPICYPLSSYENRVYEIELSDRSRVVAKFYRPQRWTRDQILEEHRFLAQLAAAEIPVCDVRPFSDGQTLEEIDGIYYSLWDRTGGRALDELGEREAQRLGMFVGRMHGVGVEQPFEHRPRLDADRYVRRQTAFLEENKVIPGAFENRYLKAAEGIAEIADRELAGADYQRIHGDLHLGNMLFRDEKLWVLDFDDACGGPPVQDLWLALPGRDPETARLRASFLEGYERFRLFDRASLRWVEVLRGLRLVRYCGWLARRYNDPAFRLAWPDFGTEDYWHTETADLEEQLELIRKGSSPEIAEDGSSVQVEETEAELTNKDFFWDWEGD